MTMMRLGICFDRKEDKPFAVCVHQAFAKKGVETGILDLVSGQESFLDLPALIKKNKITHLIIGDISFLGILLRNSSEFLNLNITIPIFVYWTHPVEPYLIFLQFFKHICFFSPHREVIQAFKRYEYNAVLSSPFFESLYYTPNFPEQKKYRLGLSDALRDVYAYRTNRIYWSYWMHTFVNDIEKQISEAGYHSIELVDKAMQKMSVFSYESFCLLRHLFSYREEFKKEILFRHSAIRSELKLLGTCNNPFVKKMVKPIPSSTFEQFKQFIADTAINICIQNLSDNVNFRALNIMGTHNVCFHSQAADLEYYFDVPKEIVSFSSLEELFELCRHYLSDAQKFTQLAKAGFEAVTNRYTPDHFVDSIFPVFK